MQKDDSSLGAGDEREQCAQNSGFQHTDWSRVLVAGQKDSAGNLAAISDLCRTYWQPLYCFARGLGHSPPDAQDMVQGFFERILRGNFFGGADREKGKFRTFLLTAFNRHIVDAWKHANRVKRGRGVAIFSLDVSKGETSYLIEPMDTMTPEKAYDRRWAFALIEQVRTRLESEFATDGKPELYDALKGCLSGEAQQEPYAKLGQRLKMSEGGVRVAVHRLRQRYRDLLRQEVRRTVNTAAEADEEIRHLFAVMAE